jgi:shikimate kinase
MAVMSREIPPVRVLLVGMMGAGKSTVGRELAKLTGWRYLDNDELLERAVGETARRVLDTNGAAALRRAESAALAEGLREEPPVIVSVAGGVVEDPADRNRIRGGGFVVWLRAPIAVLVARVGTGADRPWLQPDPKAALRRLYARRDRRRGPRPAQVRPSARRPRGALGDGEQGDRRGRLDQRAEDVPGDAGEPADEPGQQEPTHTSGEGDGH